MSDRLTCLTLVLPLLCFGCPRGQMRGEAAIDASAPKSAAHTPRPFQHCLGSTTFSGESFKPVWIGADQVFPNGGILRSKKKASPGDSLVLGVLSDTKEALPATLRGLDALAERFTKASVAAIVVLGGIDPSFEGTKTVLSHLAKTAPVLALPGDRESRSGFQAAVQNAGARVIDLVRFRAVVLSAASLIGIPGYYLPHHLLAKEQGCSYDEKDLKNLIPLAKELPAPRLLLSHGPPLGSGPQAVDWAFGRVNIGDPQLRELMSRAGIQFGLFGHVHESTGHATALDGSPVSPSSWSTSLLLNVGSADSVPHENLDGTWSSGAAAIVEIADGKARYRMLSIN